MYISSYSEKYFEYFSDDYPYIDFVYKTSYDSGQFTLRIMSYNATQGYYTQCNETNIQISASQNAWTKKHIDLTAYGLHAKVKKIMFTNLPGSIYIDDFVISNEIPGQCIDCNIYDTATGKIFNTSYIADFESGLGGWIPAGGSNLVLEMRNDTSYSGMRSMKMSNSTNMVANFTPGYSSPSIDSNVYKYLSFAYKAAPDSITLKIKIKSTWYSVPGFTADNNWHAVTLYLLGNGTINEIALGNTAVSGSTVYYIDDFVITAQSPGECPYRDMKRYTTFSMNAGAGWTIDCGGGEAKPDLIVVSASFNNTTAMKHNDFILVNVTAGNSGNSSTGGGNHAVDIYCYWDGALVSTNFTRVLGPAPPRNESWTFCNFTAKAGTHTLNITVNLTQPPEKDEWDYTNNNKTITLVVNTASTTVDLLLNGSSSNITVGRNWAVNITGTVSNTQGTLYLYNNSVQIKSCAGAGSCTDIESHPAAVGTEFNITAHYPTTQNYSAASKTWWIKINNTLPTVTMPAFNQSEVLRGRGVYISCDVTDVDDDYSDLKVNISIRDPNNVWSNVSATQAGEPTFSRSYQTNVSSPTSSLGTYFVACSVEDLNGGRAQSASTFLVWAGATITINLNATSVGWGDPVNASGQAIYNDTEYVSSSTVRIKSGDSVKCTDTTDSSGRYDCVFTAPQSMGTYAITAELTDAITGKVFTNSTTLVVTTTYGGGEAEKKSAEQVTCYEEPRIVQNPDGSIEKTTVKVCVWK